jgi:hypothetical protein
MSTTLNGAQHGMCARVAAFFDDLDDRDIDYGGQPSTTRPGYYEFDLRPWTHCAQIDDWMPLLEDGLADTDTDEHTVFIAEWLLP